MILQFGFQSQIDNIVTLIGTYDLVAARSLSKLSAVQDKYRSFIAHLQKRVPSGQAGTVNFITNVQDAQKLRPLFVNDSLLDDMAQAQVIDASKSEDATGKMELVRRALDELGIYSVEHRTLFDTIITDVFFLPSHIAKGGSTSQAIGVIWANPKTTYSIHDVMEILVHELTHHAMFIDEVRFAHYDYEAVTDKSTWARSAILNIPRPLDKVLHSAVVATEILLLRERYLGHPVRPRVHPPTAVMLAQLADAIASTEKILLLDSDKNKKAFRRRAYEILESVRQQLKELTERCAPVVATARHPA